MHVKVGEKYMTFEEMLKDVKSASDRLEFTIKMDRYFGREPEVMVDVPSWVEMGEGCMIFADVNLGAEGFGFERNLKKVPLHIHHIGKLIIGDGVWVFPNTILDRGTIDNTVIGNHTIIYCRIIHTNML